MHILTIPSWYPDHGKETAGSFFQDQAYSYLEHGNNSGIIAPQITSDIPRVFSNSKIEFNDDNGVPTYRHKVRPLSPRYPGRNDRLFVKTGLKVFEEYIAREGKPDLIHAHCCLSAGLLAYSILCRTGIPYIVTEHRSDYQQARYRKWQKKYVRLALNGASQRIAVSNHLGNLMAAQFLDAMHDWHFIPNVLSDKFYDCDMTVRTNTGGPFTFINVASLNGLKNHRDILSAFARTFCGDQKTNLVIVGGGPMYEELHELAQELGISSQVRLTGPKKPNEVKHLLEQANVFLLASTSETFGVVLIEALAAGMPVIATDCGGPADIVDDSNGILVPTKNVPELANSMRRIRENYSSYDPLRIKEETIKKYSKSAFYQNISPLLDEAIQKSAN